VKRIPHAQNVAKALRSVRLATQKALKGMNQLASQRMAKGDYTGAEVLANKAKEIMQFQTEVDVVQKRWREVCGSGDRGSKKSVTPLWTYYQPILKAIVHVGGEARRMDLEAQVHRLMAERLHPADREAMARGNERWQIMVRRSRKALVAEGWIEDRTGPVWRITDAGRRAAEKPMGDTGVKH
jgi:Mrr N-terminal domain